MRQVAPPLRFRATSDRWLFYGLLALLVWAPLPLGSNRPLPVAVLEVWVFTLAALWVVEAARGRLGVTGAAYQARWVLAGLGVWAAYGLLQVVPLPLGWLSILSPTAASHWLVSASLLDQGSVPSTVTLSLLPHGSWRAWRLGLALTGIFLLTLLLVRSRRRLRLLALVLLVAALVQAMVASLLTLTESGVWFIAPSSRAHGTFVNPNHLAGFLEMSIALGIGLLIADLSGCDSPRTWRQRLRGWSRTILGTKALVRIVLAILVIALVLTASRMGNLAFFFSLSLAGGLGVMAFRRSPRPVLLLLISLVLVDLLILGSWFGLDRVRERLEQTVLVEEARYHVDVRATGYADDFPWFGSGGGSFYAVFPAYRDPKSIPLHVAHADNDILEFQLEYGVVGMIPLAMVPALSLIAALRVLFLRGDPLVRGMAFASLMGVTAILIHSSADANLHIPANAALFMVLLALPWVGLGLDRPGQRDDDGEAVADPHHEARTRFRLALTIEPGSLGP